MIANSPFMIWFCQLAVGSTLLLGVALLVSRWLKAPAAKLAVLQAGLLAAALAPGLLLIPGLPTTTLAILPAAPPAGDDKCASPWTGNPESEASMPDPRMLGSVDANGVTALVAPTFSVPVAADLPSSVAFSWPPLLAWCYFLGVSAFLAWWGIGVAAVWIVRRSSQPASAFVMRLLTDVAGADAKPVHVSVCPAVDVPFVLGIVQPTLILPAELVRRADEDELRMVLAHEWSHISSNDNCHWQIANFARVFLFFNPLAWLAKRRLRLLQDILADAYATRFASFPEEYAQLLVQMAARRPTLWSGVALGMADRPSQLRQRVCYLLSGNPRGDTRHPWAGAVAAIVALGAAFGLATLRVSAAPAEKSAEVSAANKSAGEIGQAKVEGNAQPKQEAPKVKAPARTFVGEIRNAKTLKPIAQATINVGRTSYGNNKVQKRYGQTTVTSDANGKYEVAFSGEEMSDPFLYVYVAADHPDHLSFSNSYSMAMMVKNEKAGAKPFFTELQLAPARKIKGRVVNPDGTPARNVFVAGASKIDDNSFLRFAWTKTRTDANGDFTVRANETGATVVWIRPTEFAPTRKLVKKDTTEFGTITLRPGVDVTGRVVNIAGKPVANVWVNCRHNEPLDEPSGLPVFENTGRSTQTDAEGRFTLTSLSPGKQEINIDTFRHFFDDEKEIGIRDKTPLDEVFVTHEITVAAGAKAQPIEIREALSVQIAIQHFNSKGEKARGFETHVFGLMNGKSWFSRSTPTDKNGKSILKAPHGLKSVQINFMANEHGSLRYRKSKGEEYQKGRTLQIPVLEDDLMELEVVNYAAPMVVLRAKSSTGKPLEGAKVGGIYTRGATDTMNRFIGAGLASDVPIEIMPHSTYRTALLLPDQEIEFSIQANGHRTWKKRFTLGEGANETIDAVLEPGEEPVTGFEAVRRAFGKAMKKDK